MKRMFLRTTSMLIVVMISLSFAAPAAQDSVKAPATAKPVVKAKPAVTSQSTAKAPVDSTKKVKPAVVAKKDSSAVKKDSTKAILADSIKTDTAALASFGRCSVSTEPAEALVYIGDSLKGKSPLVIDSLLPGTIEMQIKKKGYFIKKATITIEAGKMQTVAVELTKPKRLVVVTEPADAFLKINETDTARTPYFNEKVKADTIALSITKTGFEAIADTVVLGTTGSDSLFFQLKPIAPPKEAAKAAATPAQSDRNTRVRALISLGVFLVFTIAVLAVELSR